MLAILAGSCGSSSRSTPDPPVKSFRPVLLPMGEQHFPEIVRAKQLGATVPNSKVLYDFAGCQAIDRDYIVSVRRRGFDELGYYLRRSLEVMDTRTDKPVPCPDGRACYLRVITANLDREVTIDGSGKVPCEVLMNNSTSTCTLLGRRYTEPFPDLPYEPDTDPPTPFAGDARQDHRGNIVMAKTIRIRGKVDIMHQGLVLIATERIVFETGAHIEASAASIDAPRKGRAGAASYRRIGDETGNMTGRQPTSDASDGGPGEGARYRAGAVILIAPEITGNGLVAARGIPGGEGGQGGDVECEGADGCGPRAAGFQPGNGGPGGRGGPGGEIWVLANQVGSNVRFAVEGGAGGAGGRAGTNWSNSERVGTAGAPGQPGPDGKVHAFASFEFGHYAYLFAREAARAAMQNGRHYAGAGHRTYEDPQNLYSQPITHGALARALFTQVERNYCTGGALQHVDENLISDQIHREVTALCAEARMRRQRIDSGLDYLGFPADYYVYVRPDLVARMRAKIFDAFDLYADPADGIFWRAVANHANEERYTSDMLTEYTVRRQGQSLVVQESQMAADISRARVENAGKRLARTLQRIEDNQAQIVAAREAIREATARVDAGLRPAECSAWCWTMRIYELVTAIGSAVGDLKSALALVGGLTFDGSESWFSGVKSYAKTLWEGGKLPGADTTYKGLSHVYASGKTLAEAIDTVTGTPEGPAELLITLADESADMALDIQAQLESVHQVRVTAAGADNVQDKAGALAALDTIADLLYYIRDRNNETAGLVEEHAMAAEELAVLEMESTLAALRAENAARMETQYRCRLGEETGASCSVPAVQGHAQAWAVVRDKACTEARALNERVLLFDYLLHRARDYVLLREPDPTRPDADYAAAHDLSRNLLVAEDYQQLVASASYSLEEFVAQLNSSRHGVTAGTVCRADATGCPGSGNPARDAYHAAVMRDLLSDGRAAFELSPRCDGSPEQICHPGLENDGVYKKRVVFFDVKPIMAPGYELPADIAWTIHYRHGDQAVFQMDQDTRRLYSFSPSFPEQLCHLIEQIEPGLFDFDCASIVHFRGTMTHGGRSIDGYQLAQSRTLQVTDYADPDLFGTSVRGVWELDIHDIINAMQGVGTADACYQTPLPTSCLPAECLSPCFDQSGARLPPDDPTAPAYCACYAPDGQRYSATDWPGTEPYPEACQSVPATLSPLLPVAERPPYCQPEGSATTRIEALCAAHFSDGRLRRNPNPTCCTDDGRLRLNGGPACAGTTEDTCRIPDECRRICGPRCKELEDAFQGFEYRVLWRSGS